MSTQVRDQVSGVEVKSRRVANLPFGLSAAEIIAACLALIFFVVVVVYYLVNLAPEKDRLEKLKKQEREQTAVLAGTLAPQAGQESPPVDEAQVALDSLRAFKSDYLQPRLATESKLRDLINKLAAGHGLQIVGSVQMADKRVEKKEETSEAKRKLEQESLDSFPRLEADFTVAGDYAKLRSFMKELEASKMFLLLNAVSFATQEDKDDEGGRARRVGGIQLTIKASVPFKEKE